MPRGLRALSVPDAHASWEQPGYLTAAGAPPSRACRGACTQAGKLDAVHSAAIRSDLSLSAASRPRAHGGDDSPTAVPCGSGTGSPTSTSGAIAPRPALSPA